MLSALRHLAVGKISRINNIRDILPTARWRSAFNACQTFIKQSSSSNLQKKKNIFFCFSHNFLSKVAYLLVLIHPLQGCR